MVRWLRALAWYIGMAAITATGTTPATTSGAVVTHAYDDPATARVDVHESNAVETRTVVLSDLGERSVALAADARGTSTTPASASVATNTAGTSRVGRWMGADEHVAMVDTGQVQVGRGGTTYVASPANAESYMSQAAPGSHYVEFDVPSSSLRPAGQPGWAQIPTAENTMWGKLAPQRGWDVPETPVPACNIVHVATKPSC